MKNTYTYSLLQYHHSIVLGEVLNLGLIIYLPSINRISFIHPISLNRFKIVYEDFPENTIISYYNYFQKRVKELNSNSDIFYKYELKKSLKEFIEYEFLPADSSMLQFSNYNKAVLYTNNLDNLVKKLSKLYFPTDVVNVKDEEYYNNQSVQKRSKDDWIKPDFKNKIVKIDKDFIFLPNKNELSF